MYQRLYEGDHPYVAISLSYLAADLRGLGELRGRGAVRAGPGDEPAAARATTPRWPALGNLALDLRALGACAARELDEQALAMSQRLAEQRSAPSG